MAEQQAVGMTVDPLDLGERVYLAVFHVLEPCLGQDRADAFAAEAAELVERSLTNDKDWEYLKSLDKAYTPGERE